MKQKNKRFCVCFFVLEESIPYVTEYVKLGIQIADGNFVNLSNARKMVKS